MKIEILYYALIASKTSIYDPYGNEYTFNHWSEQYFSIIKYRDAISLTAFKPSFDEIKRSVLRKLVDNLEHPDLQEIDFENISLNGQKLYIKTLTELERKPFND